MHHGGPDAFVRLGTTGGPKLCDVLRSQVATTVAALATLAPLFTTTAAGCFLARWVSSNTGADVLLHILERPGRVRRVPRVRLGISRWVGNRPCRVPHYTSATSATFAAAPSTLSTATPHQSVAATPSAPLVGVRPSAVGVGLCWSVLDRFGRVQRVCRVRLGRPTQCRRAGVLLDQVSATTTNPITPANDGV